jgi:hypothetical protein
MKNYSLVGERSEKVPARGGTKFAFAILGCISLSGGISSLQHVTQSFGEDVKYMSLIENWLPWIATLFFIIGWFIAHWLEGALLQRQIKMARILAIAYLLGMLIISLTLTNLVVHPVFNRLGSVSSSLILSGFSFRSSIFRDEVFLLMQNLFFGEKQNPNQKAPTD